MAFPEGWPPRIPSGQKNLRFRTTGTGTANFSDNAFLFHQDVSGNTYTPLPVVQPGDGVSKGTAPTVVPENPAGGGEMVYSEYIRITATGGVIAFSFDGTSIHGQVASGETRVMQRREAGIAVRGNTFTFTIEAW
jgi:hypothetical protein